jgi:hypothetical protein
LVAQLTEIVAGEFAGIALGDERLNERARISGAGLAREPSAGLPKILSAAELEGFYRFVNNPKVTFSSVLGAHVEATKRRLVGAERVVVAHDTTDFRFSNEVKREGLGPMDNGGQGFYAHFALATGPLREALGVVDVQTWIREEKHDSKPSQRERYAAPDKESLRWMRGVREVEFQLYGGGFRVVHVMDREADDYDILCELSTRGYAFVIRGSTDRRLAAEHEGQKLKAVVRDFEIQLDRDAELSRRSRNRPAKQVKSFPTRAARVAKLAISSGTIALRRPDKASRDAPNELELNVVHVSEPSPPDGCEPVEWFLLTNQPIETNEQILQVVDDYRSRWVIEEFFKALKTGCAYEQRQHESRESLLNALAVFIPIAWALLHLRHMSRDPELSVRPATEAFSETQLALIRAKSKGKLAPTPTIREAVLALARYFGGHLPSNGDPGWKLLGTAHQSLLLAELGWRLARGELDDNSSIPVTTDR